jgi:hypothetical protein
MVRLPALLCLCLATTAAADRREGYVLLEGGLGVQLLHDGAAALAPGTGLGPAGELQLFYGFTNSLHVGGYARGFWAPDTAFTGVTATLPDGSTPTGTLYENVHGFGGGALVRWRFDTGYLVAPFAQLELGVAWLRIDNQELIPTGRDFGLSLSMRDVLTADGRLAVGVEVRLLEHLVLELVLGARHTLSPFLPWQFDGALAAGVVW